eukprot:456531_1
MGCTSSKQKIKVTTLTVEHKTKLIHKEQVEVPSKYIDRLNHTLLNPSDIDNMINIAQKQNISKPFIIIISTKNKNDLLKYERQNVAIVCGTQKDIKHGIVVSLKDKFFNCKYDGLIVLLMCVISKKEHICKFYYDQNQTRRHIEKLKKDIIYRLDDDIPIIFDYSKCINIADVTQQNKLEVKDWFTNKVRLLEDDNINYYNLFVKNGYDALDSIKSIQSKQQLNDIGITKIGHQLKIWHEIDALTKDTYIERKQRLEMLLAAYYKHTNNIDSIDITCVLADYHSLLQYSNSNDEEKLQKCRAENCAILKRHCGNKTDIYKYQQDLDITHIVNQQIMDKIHYFYCHGEFVNSVSQKYNQLLTNNDEKLNIFGYEFIYDADIIVNFMNDYESVIIQKKYRSFKDELVTNNIITISMYQFNIECMKAKIHWQSYFRKCHYPKLNMECILALSLYCNFDHLQYEFSKTYRQSLNNHTNFYHWGKFLKEAVHKHGTSIKDGNIKRFYHGISQRLIPTAIVGQLGKGISIYCPLSTTSSFSVATSFTTSNNGLIISFGGISSTKYFSVDWLSDYPNEKELLFVQNANKLQIENIIDSVTGCEYTVLLNALKLMDCIFAEDHFYIHIENTHSILILKILTHQLFINMDSKQGQEFKSLNEYGNFLISVYFANKKRLTINYLILKVKYMHLFELICYKDYEWIKLDVLKAIFPNLKEIKVTNIELCSETMDNILQHIYMQSSWNLDKIVIKANIESKFTISEAVCIYERKFELVAMRIHNYHDLLLIHAEIDDVV